MPEMWCASSGAAGWSQTDLSLHRLQLDVGEVLRQQGQRLKKVQVVWPPCAAGR